MRNPVLTENAFRRTEGYVDEASVMTMRGAATKSLFLVALVMATALWSWQRIALNPATFGSWIGGAAIGGFVIAIIITFKKEWAAYLSPVYALLEGALLGAISVAADMQYPGIALQAVLLTGGVLVSLLVLYLTGIVKATENFKMGIISATMGIAAVYLIDLVLRLFGWSIPMMTDSGWMGIGFSVVVVCIAALNLVLDFDFIEQGAANGLPKHFEWYAAFGLLVTLIWLYIEILRLLMKVAARRD